MELNDNVTISIIAGTICVLSLFARLLYRSKCDTIEVGCIKIHRNTSQELQQTDSMKLDGV